MASGLWTFTQPFKGWLPGDSIEPNMCMSGGEMLTLRKRGALVPTEEYKPLKVRAKVPVVETADAPPSGEHAARTSRPKPGRLIRTETQSSQKEDIE